MNGFIAFYVGKRINDRDYVVKMENAKTYPHIIKIYDGGDVLLWDEAIKRERINHIIESKMDHQICTFLNKGLGEIIYKTLDNEFLNQTNVVGECYDNIRYKYLYSITIL
jgi:hypothetical protein